MAVKPWTEAEKLGLLFQIIEKAGTIPWDGLTLPEGRTKKACVVMIDKEKKKVRVTREPKEDGEGGEAEGGETPGKAKAGTKRKANGDGCVTPKKSRTPAAKKPKTAKAGAEEAAADEADREESAVKAEAEADEFI